MTIFIFNLNEFNIELLNDPMMLFCPSKIELNIESTDYSVK